MRLAKNVFRNHLVGSRYGKGEPRLAYQDAKLPSWYTRSEGRSTGFATRSKNVGRVRSQPTLDALHVS